MTHQRERGNYAEELGLFLCLQKLYGSILHLSLRAREGCGAGRPGPPRAAAKRYSLPFFSGLLETLIEMNTILEDIQKSLDMYLETKRHMFPRFYFLSNDDLLEILGQSRNPEAVQPHLKKCFDNIKLLKIQKVSGGGSDGKAGGKEWLPHGIRGLGGDHTLPVGEWHLLMTVEPHIEEITFKGLEYRVSG